MKWERDGQLDAWSSCMESLAHVLDGRWKIKITVAHLGANVEKKQLLPKNYIYQSFVDNYSVS